MVAEVTVAAGARDIADDVRPALERIAEAPMWEKQNAAADALGVFIGILQRHENRLAELERDHAG